MLNLEIVTPEKKVIDEEVDSVQIPTAKGEVGMLGNHAPLITTLKPGILSYTKGDSTEELVVSGGFVEVSSDKVSILADVAETSSEIDVVAAKKEKDEVESILSEWGGSQEDFEVEMEKLERARVRIEFAG